MANLKNAIKQIRKDKKRAQRNLAIKADLRTLMKKTKKAIIANDGKVEELLSQLQKSIDKAVQKGVIKKNTGSRKLSRIYSLKRKIQAK